MSVALKFLIVVIATILLRFAMATMSTIVSASISKNGYYAHEYQF